MKQPLKSLRPSFINKACPYFTPECHGKYCDRYKDKCWFGIHDENLSLIARQEKNEYDKNKKSKITEKKKIFCKFASKCTNKNCKFAHYEEEILR